VKNLNLSLIVGALFLAASTGLRPEANAQGLLVPPTDGAYNGPTEMRLPAALDAGSGTRGALPGIELPANSPEARQLPGGGAFSESISAGDLQPELSPLVSDGDYHFDCEPAILESTGTWLRRGFWYAEVDAVLMDMIRRRDDTLLMFQINGTSPTTGQTTVNPLLLQGGAQGAEGVRRLNMGRFLFRDD